MEANHTTAGDLRTGATTSPVSQDDAASDAVEQIRRMLANPRRTRR